MLQQVQRNNTITVERYTKIQAAIGSISGMLSGAADGDYSNVIFTLIKGADYVHVTPVIAGANYTISG